MLGIKNKRRQRLLTAPLAEEQVRALEDCVPYYTLLTQERRRELDGIVQVLLAEKRFDGCGGFDLTDDVRLTIAGHAAILLLGRETDFYPLLSSVLVYPDSYVAPARRHHGGGVVSDEEEPRAGESWADGSLVLSWHDVVTDLEAPEYGCNVILHEFAHQLDDENSEAEGVPLLPERSQYAVWAEVFTAEYDALVAAVESDVETLLDPYAAESPAEFYSVATETFFTLPCDLEEEHPELYHRLEDLHRQDPAALCRAAGVDAV